MKCFLQAFDVPTAVQTYIEDGQCKSSGVAVVDGNVLYNGRMVHNAVAEAIKQMMSEGFDIKPMVKFLENLMKCPSYNSIKELWNFIEVMGLTITDDGCFLAYKTVDANFKDKYTHTIDNAPGQKPERMERCEVDDNANNACSSGYHVGALGYAGPGGWYNSDGDNVVICKVNPMDVVSVPHDHSCQKLRCCYYEPVGLFRGELKASVYSGRVGDDYAAPAPKRTIVPTEVDEWHLLEDHYYIGRYTKRDGTTSTRYFLVLESHLDFYRVELCEPEENSGQIRRFNKAGLEDVVNWDGLSYHEDEYCENCGELLNECDGDCDYDEEGGQSGWTNSPNFPW